MCRTDTTAVQAVDFIQSRLTQPQSRRSCALRNPHDMAVPPLPGTRDLPDLFRAIARLGLARSGVHS